MKSVYLQPEMELFGGEELLTLRESREGIDLVEFDWENPLGLG